MVGEKVAEATLLGKSAVSFAFEVFRCLEMRCIPDRYIRCDCAVKNRSLMERMPFYFGAD